jgi:hypothetical protein
MTVSCPLDVHGQSSKQVTIGTSGEWQYDSYSSFILIILRI